MDAYTSIHTLYSSTPTSHTDHTPTTSVERATQFPSKALLSSLSAQPLSRRSLQFFAEHPRLGEALVALKKFFFCLGRPAALLVALTLIVMGGLLSFGSLGTASPLGLALFGLGIVALMPHVSSALNNYCCCRGDDSIRVGSSQDSTLTLVLELNYALTDGADELIAAMTENSSDLINERSYNAGSPDIAYRAHPGEMDGESPSAFDGAGQSYISDSPDVSPDIARRAKDWENDVPSPPDEDENDQNAFELSASYVYGSREFDANLPEYSHRSTSPEQNLSD